MTAPRVLIIGGPFTGKSTLARRLGETLALRPHEILHTDDLVGVLPWSEASDEVARWMAASGPWIIEGVAAVRALRKVLASGNPQPLDKILYLDRPWKPLNVGQLAMTKGHETIWGGIARQVEDLGIEVARGPAPPLTERA